MNTNDPKTTPEAFKYYHMWLDYIEDTFPELPDGYDRVYLMAYCYAMANAGTNGLGCFKGDATIGKITGIRQRGTVLRYRNLAMDLGWFTASGQRKGRKEILNISIPSAVAVRRPREIWSPVDVTAESDPWDVDTADVG